MELRCWNEDMFGKADNIEHGLCLNIFPLAYQML